MEGSGKVFGSRRARRLGIGAAVAVTIYFVAGFLILPSVVKSVAIKKLSAILDRTVEIGSIEINPFALSATVKEFAVKTRDGKGTTASFDELYVNVEAVSVIKKAPVVREFRVVRPYLNVIRRDDGTYNFSYLLEAGAEKKEKPEGGGPPPGFSVGNISIIQGSADFFDNPMGAVHQVRDLELSVPFVSNIGYFVDSYVQPYFAATFNGTPVRLEGRVKPFTESKETSFDIKLDKFDIPRYFEYVPVETPVRIPGGSLYLDLKLSYVQYADGRAPAIGLSGDASVVGLVVSEPGGKELASVKRVEVTMSSPDLLSRSVGLSRVIITSPSVDVVREADGGINLLKLAGKKGDEGEGGSGQARKEEGGTAPGVSLSLDFFKLADGRVKFTDHAAASPFAATVYPIDVTMLNLKTIEDWRAQVSATLSTDAGETVALDSHVGLVPVSADGTLDVRGVPLSRYMPYLPKNLLVDIADGRVGLFTKFYFSADEENPEQRLAELAVDVESLRLRKRGEGKDIVSVPEFRLADTSADALAREVTLGSIRSAGGMIDVVRGKDGAVNLATLVAKEEKKPFGTGPASPAPEAGPPWTVTVADADVSSYSIDVSDMTLSSPVKLAVRKLAIGAAGVTTKKGESGDVSLSFDIGKSGAVVIKGSAVVDPPSASLDVAVSELDVQAFQPYFADKLPMRLTGAYFSAKGRTSVSVIKDDGLRAAYNGEASVTRFAAVDKIKAEKLLDWKSLYVSGADIGYNPTSVNIKKVALTDFFAKVTVNEDRSLNLMPPKPGEGGEGVEPKEGGAAQGEQPEQPKPETAPAPEKKGGSMRVNVDTITLQGGTMEFLDRSVSPHFNVDLTELGGRISGLSSMETKSAEVDMRAIYGGFAPIEITGKMRPLSENLFVDLKADLTDMDLSPLTPYSIKFLGYTIARGKLNMDLRYKIENKELEATNKIFIDQFYLGDAVDSPDATSLPVKLALALLRDRNGEIHLDVPLSGRTDDPEFSYAGIILQVIWNIITKAVTSPFALLGAIFGGGEELGYVEFDYASFALDESDMSKLETLSKSLYDRPALKLSIEGHVDVEKDRDALRTLFFERKVKAQKLKDMLDEGRPAVPVDEVVIPPEEYNDYLEAAYDEEDFPKPRNFLGMAKSLPPDEMTKLMLTHLEVTDDDLAALASKRADDVKAAILALGQVEPERVFIVQPKTLAPEKEDGVKDSRVVFILE